MKLFIYAKILHSWNPKESTNRNKKVSASYLDKWVTYQNQMAFDTLATIRKSVARDLIPNCVVRTFQKVKDVNREKKNNKTLLKGMK